MVLVAVKSPRARQHNVLHTSTRKKKIKRSELINLAIIISVELASLHRGSGATGIANLTFKGRGKKKQKRSFSVRTGNLEETIWSN